jgi:hypothetical protein
MSNLDSAGLLGALIGLLGAGAAIFAVVWGLGIFEHLGGKRKSMIFPITSNELRDRLLAVNSSDLPYEIITSPETDLLVEWKIADAKWFAVFSKERLRETYRGFLLLDEARKSVRYCEELVSVRWMAGTDSKSQPVLSYQKQFFRGRILFQKSYEVQYGIREDLSPGKIYENRFDVRQVRNPINKVIEDSGWEFVPVVRKSHATRNMGKRS